MTEQLDSIMRRTRDGTGENVIVGLTKKEAREQDTAFQTIATLVIHVSERSTIEPRSTSPLSVAEKK
jgi:hypothetical protein